MNKGTLLLGALVCISLSGCTTISNWFYDEDELKVRRLQPIESEFTPTVLWDEDAGNGVKHYFSRLQIAVEYDKVFAASRQGVVKAFNKDSGKKVWSVDFANYDNQTFLQSILFVVNSSVTAKISGGLTVAYDTVYFGTEDGIVYALNQTDGTVKWTSKLSGEVLAPPAADQGVLVVNTSSGLLVGFDAQTGAEKWRHESDVPPLSLRGISAPTAANGGAIVGSPTGKLQVHILDTGLLAWEQAITKPSGATELERIVDVDAKPLVSGGNVYVVSYNGSLSSVELRTGRIIWNRDYASFRNVSIDGNNLFLVDNNSVIYAVDRRNGVELWSRNTLKGRSITAATPSGDYIVVGDNFGYLHWLSQETGKIVSRIEVGGDDEDGAIFNAPVEHDGLLYVQTRDGDIAVIKIP